MADFSGIGAFGAGAVEGYDAGLSRYATIEDMRRRREAEQRAAQAQALQSLISGTQLATQHPGVAEQAALDPERYGLSPETVGAGVARARAMQSAAQKFARGIQTGEFDENDPEIGQFVAQDPVKYAPLLNEALGKKRLRTMMDDPMVTDQQIAQVIVASGLKVDMPMLQASRPGLVGAVEKARTAGGLRGQMEPTEPGGPPLVSAVEGAKVTAAERGKSDVFLEPAPANAGPYGKRGVSRGQAMATEKELGTRTGDVMGRAMPLPAGLKPELSGERFIADARETEAQRALRMRQANAPPGGQIGPKDVSSALSRNRTAARIEVQNELRNAKIDLAGLPIKDQQEIINYYTQLRLSEMAKGDPILADQQIAVPPRTPAIDAFEAGEGPGYGSQFLNWVGSWFRSSGEPPAANAPAAAPRSLRNPAGTPEARTAVPAPPGAQEGDKVRQKSTGQYFRVEHGYLVPWTE